MGFPSPAKDYHENRIDLNELLIAHPAATFPMKTDTDAMIGDGILKGSLVLVDRSLQVKSGMIIVAVHEGELIMRRLEIQGVNFLIINSGVPISTPRFFASSLLAIAQPSLFDNTTIASPASFGSNNRSHEQ